MTPLPEGLSQGAGQLWRTLHAGADFSADADELLARGLRRFDLGR
jgi:hypothetical protein